MQDELDTRGPNCVFVCQPCKQIFLLLKILRPRMPHVFLGVVFATASMIAAAQQVIGVGWLKIGMTFTEFQQSLAAAGTSVEEARDRSRFLRATLSLAPNALILLPNATVDSQSPGGANYVPGFKAVYVSRLALNGVQMGNLQLLFRDDRLISLRAPLADAHLDALTAVFGVATERIGTRQVNCTVPGATEPRKETDRARFLIWREDDTISAYATVSSIHDGNCQVRADTTLNIFDKRQYADYPKLNAAAKAAYLKTAPGASAPPPAPTVAAPVPAPAPVPAHRAASPPLLRKVEMQTELGFAPGSADLDGAGKAAVLELLDKLRTAQIEIAVVIGHADPAEGSAPAPLLGLSEARAQAVKAFALSQGFAPNNWYVDQLSTTKATEAKEQYGNRRVTIQVVGTTGSP